MRCCILDLMMTVVTVIRLIEWGKDTRLSGSSDKKSVTCQIRRILSLVFQTILDRIIRFDHSSL